MGGAASGKYTVKSCGNAHAWCRVCRPDMPVAFRKPKPPAKTGMPSCRNCGRCDHCLGLVAPEGMKTCRQCGETKPLSAFTKRRDAGTYRNQCMRCMNGPLKSVPCQECGRRFTAHGESRTLCPQCRPVVTKPCSWCGAQFTGSTENRRYCSARCRETAFKDKRAATRRAHRIEALYAYSSGGEPVCSCCGESTLLFLAIDHINGGGHKQQKELGGGGYTLWLRKNNYPEGFRLLCHNCNFGRQLNGGTCPHMEAD